ncbi:hypothetical protein J4480_03675 [Candidatus Woesearchaeota archaeon]|nr:hypothetical protein [Candidatus Woesearchaeota archaeon]
MDPEKKGAYIKSISKKLDFGNIFIGLTVLLGILLVINLLLTSSLNKDLRKSAQELKEKLKPAKIEITSIKNSKCSDCFDISAVLSYVKSSNVNATKEKTVEFDSKDGRDLIKKYGIKKIPALVVTGEIEKVSIEGLEKNEDALLFTETSPPYTDALTGKIEGMVALYILKDSSCDKCNDLVQLISQIKAAGVKVSTEKKIEPSSDEGKELIKKYSIGFAPAIILSKEAAAYDIMQEAWLQIGTKEDDGSYVLRSVYPPYINLTTGKLRGLVDLTYLVDKSCTPPLCYNVSVHREILTNPQGVFTIKLEKEETVDVEDAKGKELIAKYNITQVPMVIISDEASAYPSSQALKQFFSIEKDGFYVFRRLQVLGTYRDLTTGQIVKAQNEEQS